MTNNPTIDDVPKFVGQEKLVGLYYPARCTRCGWVGSSGELTEDDAECTRQEGDRLCLGCTEEIDVHDMLAIVQAMALDSDQSKSAIAQLQAHIAELESEMGEPVAYQWRCKTVNDGSQWRHWVDCTEEDYNKTTQNPEPTSRGIIREARRLYAEQPVLLERSPKDYAIEHAEYMAKSADTVLAKFQAYGLALLACDEGGDDGEGELLENIDSTRSDLQEALVDLRSMVYEFRKRSNRCTPQ